MKKSLVLVALASAAMLASCNGTGSTCNWSSVALDNFELTETDIGTSKTADATKMAAYTEAAPLKIGLVTDSGTLNDHSFNESAWNGVNGFATTNGGGTVSSTSYCVETGKIQTKYVQPAKDAYDTNGRVAAIKSVVTWGAKVVILPGFLFESAIKVCINDTALKDVCFLALDCNKEDPDNGYKAYEYTDKVTSIIYREEQAGFEAGYAAVKEGYRKLGFCGGMAVPAVVRYGSGYCQGADVAAQELKLNDCAINIQYYYAGQFAATAQATTYCTNWYKNGTEVIFGCGGAVYNSVTTASQANNNKPWIGVDVNQHADTSLGASQASCITSAMKNLLSTTEIMLASWVNEGGAWKSAYAKNVITVGAKSDNCVLPTPDTTGDSGCWGFKNFSIADYTTLLGKLKAGTIKVNSNSDNDKLVAANFSCSAKVKVNYIK
jgi:basic membrane protein A